MCANCNAVAGWPHLFDVIENLSEISVALNYMQEDVQIFNCQLFAALDIVTVL